MEGRIQGDLVHYQVQHVQMKIVKYFAVGGMAAIVDIGCFFLFTSILNFGWFQSALGSFILATAVNYFLSIKYVFQSGVRFQKYHEVILIFLVSGTGLIINQLILWLLIENMSVNMLVSKITATTLLFFWNYGLRKTLVFPERLGS